MPCVATAVFPGPPRPRADTADGLAAVRAALEAAGLRPDGDAVELAPGRAFDLPVLGAANDPAGVLAELPDDLEVDLAVQPVAGRRKRLLVADMESTVIENEMLDELAERVGAGERVAAITARAMNGELDFREALRERVALLAGLDASVLEECRGLVRVDPGAATLVATLRAHGVTTALVSGGFMVFAEPVAERLGFDHCQANRLEVEDGVLTGRTLEPVLDKDAKVQALDELCRRLDCGREAAVTIGDGANDLPMLRASGLGVAYHGKPAVASAAPQRIDRGDLSTLLFYLGYPESEWTIAPAPTFDPARTSHA